MALEIEHAPGTPKEAIIIAEKEFIKDMLAVKFGESRRWLDERIEECKTMFNCNRKEIEADFQRQRDAQEALLAKSLNNIEHTQ
jgi:hypothetical protein